MTKKRILILSLVVCLVLALGLASTQALAGQRWSRTQEEIAAKTEEILRKAQMLASTEMADMNQSFVSYSAYGESQKEYAVLEIGKEFEDSTRLGSKKNVTIRDSVGEKILSVKNVADIQYGETAYELILDNGQKEAFPVSNMGDRDVIYLDIGDGAVQIVGPGAVIPPEAQDPNLQKLLTGDPVVLKDLYLGCDVKIQEALRNDNLCPYCFGVGCHRCDHTGLKPQERASKKTPPEETEETVDGVEMTEGNSDYGLVTAG